MNWSSVKNLLIGILVAANLFLIYNIAAQTRTRGYIPNNELVGAVELLAKRGLIVPVETVPMEKFKAPVYESRYSDEYYTKVAQTLAGSPRELLISLPGGGFNITAKNGDLVEFDREFGFRYTKNVKTEMQAYTDITAEAFEKSASSGESIGAARLSALTRIAEKLLDIPGEDDSSLHTRVTDGYHDPESGLTFLLARQSIGECDVYSHYAVCVFDGDELIGAQGRWYFAPLGNRHRAELVDQINALFIDCETLMSPVAMPYEADLESESETLPPEQEEQNEYLSVRSMSACYIVYWNADKTALFFIPAWQIDHTNGQFVVYNATNGTVYSRNP